MSRKKTMHIKKWQCKQMRDLLKEIAKRIEDDPNRPTSSVMLTIPYSVPLVPSELEDGKIRMYNPETKQMEVVADFSEIGKIIANKMMVGKLMR